MNKDLKSTLRLVCFIATPMCLVNSFIFSFNQPNFLIEWLKQFLTMYIISFPQAILYVSLIKKYDSRKKINGH